MKAHARRRPNCRVRDRGRLRFWWSVPVRGRVRVRVRSKKAPDAKHTGGQWSLRRAQLRAKGPVSVRIRFWLPRPHTSICPWSRRPPESSRELQPGLGNDMVSFRVPCRVNLLRFWIAGAWCCQMLELGPHGERALPRVRFRSMDIAREVA